MKRNALGAMARGQVFVQFDDDDLYLPNYVDSMVHALLLKGATSARPLFDATAAREDVDDDLVLERCRQPLLVKLAQFTCYNARQGTLQVCDVRPPDPNAPARTHRGRPLDAGVVSDDYHSRFWGYGFTYVYTAAFLKLAQFANITFGEDYQLVCEAASRGATCRAFMDDQRDPCVLHVLHNESSTMTPTSQIVALASESRRRYGDQLRFLFGDDLPESVPHSLDPFSAFNRLDYG